MSDFIPLDESELGPEPPDLKHLGDLFERYEQRFGEQAPLFTMPHETQAQIALLEKALKTGRPITTNIPPGCVA